VTTLVDRIDERGVVDQLVLAATAGLSGTCVLVGEAGMGKTALLEYAVERSEQLRHLVISGVEAETELGYGALHRLLRPFLPQRHQLPRPQRAALESAFGLESGEPADRFLVGLACLSLLADSATEQGLLCIVDDAQWLDRESLEALSFVSRRLEADGIALVFAIRDLGSAPGALDGLPTVTVAGLPDDAALALLSSRAQLPVEPDTARRLVSSTDGCPLALIELASTLTEQQLRGGELFGESLPIGQRLEDHFLEKVRELDAKAQLFLLVAATESSGDPMLVRRAADELGSDVAGEDGALASGLIALRPNVVFRHPLIRAAVYSGVPRGQRDAVHRTLAVLLDGVDLDRRVRHLAAAARQPDADLALELEEAGMRAASRGGYAAAVSAFLEAARLSPRSVDRAQRSLRAANSALLAGLPQRAEALLNHAFPHLEDPELRARAMLLDGTLRTPLADPASAPARLVAAAEALAPFDDGLARDAFIEAFSACMVAQRFTVGTTPKEVAQVALATIDRIKPAKNLVDFLLEGTAHLFLSDTSNALPLLERAVHVLRAGDATHEDTSRLYNFVMGVLNELGDDVTYNLWVKQIEQQARERGALIVLQLALLGRAKTELRSGRFMAAEMTYDEAVAVTGVMGSVPKFYELLKCELFAWRGQQDEARATAAKLRKWSASIGSAAASDCGDLAISLVELAAGRWTAAFEAIKPMLDPEAVGWNRLAFPIAIEATSRNGQRELATHYLSEMSARTPSATSWGQGQVALGRALIADDRDADVLYQQAIRLLESTTVVVEALQARLAYGEWLRRQKRRGDARIQLRIAYNRFSEIGATGFAARARAELEATGERAPTRSVGITSNLTPQESQAARRAASGATNKEIAAEMYISANTVDYHLRKVFRKLGISSRFELRDALPPLDT
jgi:DNA-binding CsgD family transcriptional regulator